LSQQQPEVFQLLGSSVKMLENELKKMEIYNQLKDSNISDKMKTDYQSWSDWLNLYKERLLEEISENSENSEQINSNRIEIMNSNNPKFILRNYLFVVVSY